MASVFISYSRSNRQLAAFIHFELARAGHQPWHDVDGMNPTEQWAQRLESEIQQSNYFLLLLPANEKYTSNIDREYQLAQQYLGSAKIFIVKLTDDPPCEHFSSLHVFSLKEGYRTIVQQLLSWLCPTATLPPAMTEILKTNISVASITPYLPSYDTRKFSLPDYQSPKGCEFIAAPLSASSYSRASWVCPSNGNLKAGSSFAVLLIHSNDFIGTVTDTLTDLLTRGKEPELLVIEGPYDEEDPTTFSLPENTPYVWEQCIHFASSTIDRVVRSKPLALYARSPVSIGIAVASKLRVRQPFSVYHLIYDKGEYVCIYESGGRGA